MHVVLCISSPTLQQCSCLRAGLQVHAKLLSLPWSTLHLSNQAFPSVCLASCYIVKRHHGGRTDCFRAQQCRLPVEHVTNNDIHLQERWEQVEQLYHNNLVQAIGLRDCTVYQLQQLMASSKIVPSVVSVEIHPYHNNWDLVKFCKKQVEV